MIKKNTMWKIITVTMVALAAAILTTAIAGGVHLIGGKSPAGGDGDGGSQNQGSDRLTITAKNNPLALAIGTNPTYKKYVEVSGYEGELDWKVDTSKVDLLKAGTYTVKYTVTDSKGKTGTYNLKINVIDSTYTEEDLMTLVAKRAKETVGYTKEEAVANKYSKEKIVRDIYEYVRDPKQTVAKEANIHFDYGPSNDPNQKNQSGSKNRNGWKTDWIDEAYLTLTLSHQRGDCYTFYSVSKAFFEYYGIESVCVVK